MRELTNWVPVFRILGAMTLFLSSIWLIPTFGFIGAAYSVVLAFIVMSISIYLKTYRIYKVPYNWRGILFPLIILIGIQFNFNHLSLKLLLSMIYPLLWYLFIINRDEKEGLLRLFK